MPTARSRFHDGNCDAHGHPSPITGRNIPPSRDALLTTEDHKNKSPPNAPRPSHRHAPSAYYRDTRRPRSIRDRACDLQSPWPTRPCARLSPVPSPNNALQDLHRHRPFPNCDTKREAILKAPVQKLRQASLLGRCNPSKILPFSFTKQMKLTIGARVYHNSHISLLPRILFNT